MYEKLGKILYFIKGEEYDKIFIDKCLENVLEKFPIKITKEQAVEVFEKLMKKDFSNINLVQKSTLINFANSCFMDSVLIAMLMIPNDYIDEQILYKKVDEKCVKDIQTELKKIQLGLYGKQNFQCRDFRKLLQQCKIKGFEEFYTSKTQDANEFLKYIFELFNVERSKDLQITCVLNEGDAKAYVSSKFEIENSSPMFDINFTILQMYISTTINALLNHADDSGKLDEDSLVEYQGKKYNKRLQFYKPLEYNYFVVGLQRLFFEKFSITSVVPEKTLNIGNKKLTLSSIIVWLTGHYVSLIRNGDKWYLYDDIGPKMICIGSYEDMIKDENILRFGVLYFYN